ncbi:MAG: hypothetical protein JWN49_294 [Parcubacteria group bacterium]|nr:hypothetical protein [Parcubacteria group bacterium]
MENPVTLSNLRLPKIETPTGLLEGVFARIRQEQVRLARMRTTLYSVGMILSLGTGSLVTVSLARSLRASGFYEYASLALSGDSLFLTYWRELSFSLLESVPFITLLMFLVVLLVLVWTAANTLTNVRKIVRIA